MRSARSSGWISGAVLAAGRSVLLLIVCRTADAQAEATAEARGHLRYFGAYSNDSSHIILGYSYNRQFVDAGATYEVRLKNTRVGTWFYDVDLHPLLLLREPQTTVTGTSSNPAITVPTQVFTTRLSSECQPSQATGVSTFDGQPLIITETTTCGHRIVYGFGISPLGQRFVFPKVAGVHPYVVLNAGINDFTARVPDSQGSRGRNFEFEAGTGLERMSPQGRRVSLDGRLYHISNAGTARTNPGIDGVIFRLTYSYAR